MLLLLYSDFTAPFYRTKDICSGKFVNLQGGGHWFVMIFLQLAGFFQQFREYVCPASSAPGSRLDVQRTEDRGQRAEIRSRRSEIGRESGEDEFSWFCEVEQCVGDNLRPYFPGTPRLSESLGRSDWIIWARETRLPLQGTSGQVACGQAGSVDAISRAIRFLSPGLNRFPWLVLHSADSSRSATLFFS